MCVYHIDIINTLEEYKRCKGKVFSTVDGHIYVRSKISEENFYLELYLGEVVKKLEGSIGKRILLRLYTIVVIN